MHPGSHSRESFPFDKRVPKMPKRVKTLVRLWTGGDTYREITRYDGFNTQARLVAKHMHKKKQRQHDHKLCRDGLDEINQSI